MPLLSFLKVGLLALLERLDLVPKEVSDRAAIEYVQKYGMPQPASDDGFGYQSYELASKPFPGEDIHDPDENIPDLHNPGLNILGTSLRSCSDGFHLAESIPDLQHPGLNILGTPLRSDFDI